MRTRNLIGASLLVFLVFCAQGQQEQRYVLLPVNAASELAKMYPKNGPDRIDGSWQATQANIDGLEASLSHITEMRSGGAPNGRQIEHPDSYYPQYVAAIRAGQKLIYVNAVCDVKGMSYWHEHLAIVFDGGSCFWQVWFDTATKKFFQLSINGVA